MGLITTVHTWNPSTRKKLRQEDCHEFKASLGYQDPKSKIKKTNHTNMESFDLGQFLTTVSYVFNTP